MLDLDTILDFASQPKGPNGVEEFVSYARPLAESVGKRLGVDPNVLIGQWGLETGWGKSVIPGTNNFGNIKDFSGGGVGATDNMTGGRDKYRAYGSPDDFGADYARLIERRYRNALNSGEDAERFAAALKDGGYAEDPDYVAKLVGAANTVRGSAKPAATQSASGSEDLFEFIDSYKPDEDYRIAAEGAAQAPMRAQLARNQAASDESPISTSIGRGWEFMKDAVANFGNVIAGDEQAIVERQKLAQQRDFDTPMPASQKDFLDKWRAENYSGALMNPAGAFSAMVEQLPNSLPSMAGSIPGMIGGATYGSAFGPVGTLVGGAIGAFIGSAPGSVALETGARITEMAARDGVDLANPEAFASWLQANRENILTEGAKKGVTVAAFDGLAGGIGARIVMGPALKFANAERELFQRLGVNAADKAAVDAARKSAPYRTAMAPAYAELQAASTVAQHAMRGAASFTSETAGEGFGEYYGEVAATGEGSLNEALLEALLAGKQSAITTGAQLAASAIINPPKLPTNKPDSPLTNAANAGANTQPPGGAAPGALPTGGQPAAGSAPVAAPQQSPLDQRLEAVRTTVEDKDFIRAIRATQGLGAESVTEILSAYAKAKNPTIDPMIRERALDELERFITMFANRPNFTMGQGQGQAPGTSLAPLGSQTGAPTAQAAQGGAVGPAIAPDDGMTLDGEVIQRPEKLAGANPNQLAAPPVHGLPSPEAVEAKRAADADYEQAFQDLVKADALAQSGNELEAVQRRMIEAEQRLNEINAAIDGNQAAESEAKRRRVLAGVLANPQVQNHEAAFAAELNRQGFRDNSVSEAERARIARFIELRDTFTAPPEVEPSAPNEFDPYAPPKAAPVVALATNEAEAGTAPPYFDVGHAASAAYEAPENEGIRKAWNDAQLTRDDEGNVSRAKHDHFDEWYSNAKVSADIGRQYDAHGIAKGNPLGALLNILQNGINPTRRFDTAPLLSGADGSGAGIGTASGGAYKDGPFIVLGERGKTISESGVKTVLVSDAVASVIPALQARFPNITFVTYGKAHTVLGNEANIAEEARQAIVTPAPEQPKPPAITPVQIRESIASGARLDGNNLTVGETTHELKGPLLAAARKAEKDASDRAVAGSASPAPAASASVAGPQGSSGAPKVQAPTGAVAPRPADGGGNAKTAPVPAASVPPAVRPASPATAAGGVEVKPTDAVAQDAKARELVTIYQRDGKDAANAAFRRKADEIDALHADEAIATNLKNDLSRRFRELLAADQTPKETNARTTTANDRTEEGQAPSAQGAEEGEAVAPRTPWADDFPQAVIMRRAEVVQSHPDYRAAKDGEWEAAARLVDDIVTDADIEAVRKMLAGRGDVVVAVHAEEAGGRNKIPLALATLLSDRLGLKLDRKIVQARKVDRGGSDGFHRLATQVPFTGEVEKGAEYLLIDDTLAQGGTLASLKGYIETNGGTVVGATALMGKQYSSRLASSKETLSALRSRYGGKFEQWWKDEFGYGFDKLTESEARYLSAIRGADADAIRDRILAARQGRDGGKNASVLPGASQPSDQVSPAGTSPAISKNTIFTDEAAAAARARLKKKLGQLNSGLDPEMMMDGITLAGYHIEKGARTFVAYAKAMVADLGDGAKPFLKSWYLGVRFDPRAAGFDGMDGAASVEAADVDALLAEKPEPKAEIKSDLDAKAHEAATSPLNDRKEPTEGQIEAGNYKVGKARIIGMDVSIENPKGSKRKGVDKDGNPWERVQHAHYGYFLGTEAKDGDHLDVYLTGDAERATKVWVVDQIDEEGRFDEHKIVVGPDTEAAARQAYLDNYREGWTGLGAITSMPVEAFKAWALDGKKKRKALAYVEPEKAEARPEEPATASRIVSILDRLDAKEEAEDAAMLADMRSVDARNRLAELARALAPVGEAATLIERTDRTLQADAVRLPVTEQREAAQKAIRALLGAMSTARMADDALSEGRPQEVPALVTNALHMLKEAGDYRKAMIGYLDAVTAALPEVKNKQMRGEIEAAIGRAQATPIAAANQTVDAALADENGPLRSAMRKDFYALSAGERAPLEVDANGVPAGAKSNTDRVVEAGGPAFDAIYNGFAKTRDLMRKMFGDRVTLYRADAAEDERKVPNKPTLFAADRATAQKFATGGRGVVAVDVEIDDIIAAPHFDSGYFEFVVRNPANQETVKKTSAEESKASAKSEDEGGEAVKESTSVVEVATSFEEMKTALKIIGDPEGIGELLKAAGIAYLPRKDGVAVPNKANWDLARKTVPLRIERHTLDGLNPRYAEIDVRVFEDGTAAIHGVNFGYMGGRDESVAAAIAKYRKGYEGVEPESGEAAARSELDDVAERIADDKTAAHIEDGEAESATPAVVAESVQKSADRTPLNLKEAKQYLLKEIDAAIVSAPDYNPVEALDRAKSRKFNPAGVNGYYQMSDADKKAAKKDYDKETDRLVAEAEKVPGFITFDVPGDGRFKVLNFKDRLRKFRSTVNNSAGFRESSGKKSAGGLYNPEVKGGSYSVREMLDDGDLVSAYEYAKALGKPLLFGKAAKAEDRPVVYIDAEMADLPDGIESMVGRVWSNGKAADWKVIELTTGRSLASGSDKAGAVRVARDALEDSSKRDRLLKVLKEAQEKEAYSQDQLAADWLEWAEAEQARIYERKEAEYDKSSKPPAGTPNMAASQAGEVKATDFITSPDGSIDFGEITQEMAQAMRRQAGKIRLQRGDKSYGLVHIEDRHGKDIRGVGFAGVPEFVSDALKHIQAIWKPSRTSQLVVVEASEHGKVVFIELKPDDSGGFYTVNSAFPTPQDYADKKSAKEGWEKLWSDMALPPSAPATQSPSAGQPSVDAGEGAATPSGQSTPSVVDAGGSGNGASIPAGYKKVTEYYRDGVPTDGYAPFAEGERVRMKDSGLAGTVESLFGPGPVFESVIVKFDNGARSTMKASGLEPSPGQESDASTALSVGDAARLMGIDVILAKSEEIDGVRYELFNANALKDDRAVLRRTDIDSGETVDIRSFPNYDAAEEAVGEARKVAEPEQSDDADTFTEDEARKRMSWRDKGTQGGIRTYELQFFAADGNMESGRGAMNHAEIQQSVGKGGDKKFRVYSRGGDYVGVFESLREAKAAAIPVSLESVRSDGYLREAKTADHPDAAMWDALPESERLFLARGATDRGAASAMRGPWASLSAQQREVAGRILDNRATLIRALTSDVVSADEYPTEDVAASYNHISHHPKDAAMVDRNAFLETIQDEYEAGHAVAETDAQKDVLRDEIESLKAEYLQREAATRGARGNAYSAKIAGRGNLDSKGVERRNGALDNATAKFSDWLGSARGRVKAAVLAARNSDQLAAVQQAKDEKAAKRHASLKEHVGRLLNFTKGDGSRFGAYPIARVTMDRDGYPSSVTVEATDLTDNKFDIAKTLFGGDKDKLRALVDEIRAEAGGQAPSTPAIEADRIATVEQHNDFMKRLYDGDVSLDEFKAHFASVVKSESALLEELGSLTKAALLEQMGGYKAERYKNDKKDMVVKAAHTSILDDFVLGNSISYSFGQKYGDVIAGYVERTTQEDIEAFAQKIKAQREARKERMEKMVQAIKDPQSLDDFRTLMRAKVSDGMTRNEAYRSLTPEQRIRYDELEAESTRERREASKNAQRTETRAAAKTVAGEIIETKHTRDGYDLFVVQPSERVERDTYNLWNATAKRLGGWYSKFRGSGAVPGFQFKTREGADAFLKFIGGDAAGAQEAVQARRDAFDDDKSQSAVERLNAMADRLDERADESLSRERKANTTRRARMAAGAEAAANSDKALAATMRNIASAIESGTAKFLDRVRQKVQVELLSSMLGAAKRDELAEKYKSYENQEAHRGEAATVETVDYVRFPEYAAFRSDLARLGRQMQQFDGAKRLGDRLMSVADDVTDAYLQFARENLHKVSTFSINQGKPAVFSNKDRAEVAIARSNLRGKAIVLPFKRGENIIVMSPQMAQERGIWQGDPDKKITLTPEFGAELVEKARELNRNMRQIDLPWVFDTAYDRRRQLAGMGIETAPELRSALREFVGLKEVPKGVDRVKELERAMVGRRNDGLDFFPTPAAIADEMVEAAEIEEGMSVLEPSAGMGHIAERIREAGVDPDVVELSGERAELLEAKGFRVVTRNIMALEPRKFFTFGDLYEAPDGTRGIMRGVGGMGSNRVRLENEKGERIGLYDRDELKGVEHRGSWSGYDRIIMNPPFSDRRDAEHVQHAYTLLRPGGRLVALMGEGVFFGKDKKAEAFREWLDSVGGTSEKLPEGTFNDPSLPVTTGVNARMVVIDRPKDDVPATARATPLRTGEDVSAADAQALADTFLAEFAESPEINVVQWYDDLPQDVRASLEEQKAPRSTKGVFFRGRVHLVAGNHESVQDVEETIFHEILGHVGVRKLFGAEFVQKLNQVFFGLGGIDGLQKIMDRRGKGSVFAGYVRRLTEANRKDPKKWTEALVRAILTEEVHAFIAEKGSKGLYDRFMALVGMVRDLLRRAGFSLAELGESDLLYTLSRARDGLRGERDTAVPDGIAVTRRDDGDTIVVDGVERPRMNSEGRPIHPTEEGIRNFWRWFGESRVVDEQGRPLVVYHGTHADIAKFKRTKGAHLGFHFGDQEAALIRLEDTADGRVDEADRERQRQVAEEKFRRYQALKDEFARRRADVPSDELLRVIESGEDVGAFIATFDYVPTPAEAERLRTLKEEYDNAKQPIHATGVGANTMAVHLAAQKLLRLPDVGNWGSAKAVRDALPWDSDARSLGQIKEELVGRGYDGIVYANRVENPVMKTDSYIIFNPNQIKSATGNTGAFDPSNDSIVARITDEDEVSPPSSDNESKGADNGPLQSDRPGLRADQDARRTVGGSPRVGWAEATRIRSRDGKPAAAARGAQSRLVADDFRREALGRNSKNPSAGLGVWFALTGKDDVTQYGPEVESFHLDIRNPKVYTSDTLPAFQSVGAAFLHREKLRKQGHDGIVVDHRAVGGPVHAVAFDANQAIYPEGKGPDGGNEIPAVTRIAEELDTTPARSRLMDKIAELFSTTRTFNWWDRTVGSQFNKAKKSPEFNAVFQKGKAFISDVSRFANKAADRARSILPHMDTFADIGKGANLKRQWSDAKDYQEIAQAIFDGTLENRVYTRRELREQFGLNDRQADLYAEFRAATDYSLETLVSSELARAARAGKLQIADPDMELDEAVDFYTSQIQPAIEAAQMNVEGIQLRHEIERETLDTIEVDETFDLKAIEAAKKARDARQAEELAEAQAELQAVIDFRDSFDEKAAKFRELQANGYAPLMRYGQYTVDVVRLDEDGNPELNDEGEPDRPFFGMFEAEAEAKEAAKILAEEYPGYTVSRGVLSTKANELYRGLTPETAEMFARLLGTDEEGAFQAYLKQAVANRSAMKRLIRRKGMDGFSRDVPRVLASFITSNARLASGNWHFGEMAEAAQAIPQNMGDVKDEAVKLMQYIQNPQEEAASLRGFLFFTYLGGSVASAMVNMTQTFTTTLPYLSKFGTARAGKEITAAMGLAGKLMAKKDGIDAVEDVGLRAALHRASDEGVIDPQEIHLLMAESGGSGNLAGQIAGRINKDAEVPAERAWRAFTQAWGSLFGAAEKYNRHVAFIAAYRMAPEGADAYQFAVDAVEETQFLYTKVSRPNWGRGAIGATLFTFRTFIINYIEFLSRLPRKQQALALAALVLLAGMSGLPGMDDLDDVVDTVGQKLGYNWNNKAGRHAWLVKTLGGDAANFIEHGVSAMLPLDVSARLSAGNLIPMTGLLKESTQSRARDTMEFFGAAGSLAAGAAQVFDDIGSGKDFDDLIRPVAPKAFNDLAKAIDIWQTGEYRDTKGRKIVDADWLDGLVKLGGFHPSAVAEPRRVEFMLAQSAEMVRAIRADIHETLALGRYENDISKVRLAYEMQRRWNEKNPETPIRINPSSIAGRVRAMRSSSAERLVKATPRDMRSMMRDKLAVE